MNPKMNLHDDASARLLDATAVAGLAARGLNRLGDGGDGAGRHFDCCVNGKSMFKTKEVGVSSLQEIGC